MQAYPGRERRRRHLAGRVARVTFPVRHSVGEFIEGFPCNVIGHHWVEIPRTQRRRRLDGDRKMHFKCSRCFLEGRFTN
jgi:hypothetical protein